MDEWIKKVWHINPIGYYSALEKKPQQAEAWEGGVVCLGEGDIIGGH